MLKPKTALISVTDKTGVVEFAQGLEQLGFTILSTGGTAKFLRDHKINVVDVADYTASPEILDGRVKTLHPKIHAGILADRRNPAHVSQLQASRIDTIDLVAVNLYDFAGEVLGQNRPLETGVHFIDIGGPSLLRGAAKNYLSCLPIVDPSDYPEVLRQWAADGVSDSFRRQMAAKVFQETARYDAMIARCFIPTNRDNEPLSPPGPVSLRLPQELKIQKSLRYGENSQQQAALIVDGLKPLSGLAAAVCLQGKELSYNNYCDLDAAVSIVAELAPLPAITIIKHTNPCGTAASSSMPVRELFLTALGCDQKCAFGGVVASNQPLDGSAARAMTEVFLECVIAPGYTNEALAIFAAKKNLRLLQSTAVEASDVQPPETLRLQSILGGFLAQTPNHVLENSSSWTCVSDVKPTPMMLSDLQFAMRVCKHVKSNAIVVASGLKTIGVGAGQMSRIDSTQLALDKARELGHVVKGSVLASDAFFPFRDCVDAAAQSGIMAIVQPGGSLRDQESIDAANEHRIVMMLSGARHFKH
jgi:phosphoribosylaminoimidazolecarboxamide formyltransferase/IMP cyclohydrolase